MVAKLCTFIALVAAASAEYSQNAMSYGSYANQLMVPDPYAMPEGKTYSNYVMEGANMYDSPGMYQSYMAPPERMSGPDVYSGYYKQASNPSMMSGLNGRYTSTPTTVQQDQMYGQMSGRQSDMSYTTFPAYNNGAQMPYNNYGTDMPAMPQGYAGYAQSSMRGGNGRAMMTDYQSYQDSTGQMMMMNGGHYSHQMPQMPSSYASFNGNEANYRW